MQHGTDCRCLLCTTQQMKSQPEEFRQSVAMRGTAALPPSHAAACRSWAWTDRTGLPAVWNNGTFHEPGDTGGIAMGGAAAAWAGYATSSDRRLMAEVQPPADADERTWHDLYAENERLRAERDAASETARSMLAKVVQLSEERAWVFATADEEVHTDRNADPKANPVRKRVDAVVGDLLNRDVMPADRKRLGDALDTANKPQAGRAGADEAIRKAIRWTNKGVL